MMRKSKKSFFTLLEVLVSMGVFMLLMLALMQFFSAAQGVWSRTGSKTSLYDSARIVMEVMANDLACAYYEPDHGSDFLFFKIDQSDPKQVVFAAQTEAGNAEIFYKYDDANWKLHRIEKKEEDQDFSSDVTWFTRSGKDWIADLDSIAAEDSNCVAENILDFSVKAYKKNNLAAAVSISSSATDKFPDVVIISMTLLADDVYETLKNRFKAENIPDADVPGKIKALYTSITTALDNNTSPQETDNTKNEDSKEVILYNGCLRLSRIITLDRGQNN